MKAKLIPSAGGTQGPTEQLSPWVVAVGAAAALAFGFVLMYLVTRHGEAPPPPPLTASPTRRPESTAPGGHRPRFGPDHSPTLTMRLPWPQE